MLLLLWGRVVEWFGALAFTGSAVHGSLEEFGCVITGKVCHSKADISVLSEKQLLKIYRRPFPEKSIYQIRHLSHFVFVTGNSMAEAWENHMPNVFLYPAQ